MNTKQKEGKFENLLQMTNTATAYPETVENKTNSI